MRVAIIAEPYVPVPPVKYGGTEWVIHYLIKGLLEMGHEPILFGPGDSTVNCEIIPTVNQAIFFPKSKTELKAHLKRVDAITKNTEKLLRENLPRIDLIHSHHFDLMNFQDFPNLTTLHGPFNFENMAHYLARKNLFYVSISHNQQDACPDLQYVGVVYNGEDPSLFPMIEQPEDYVCFLGRFDREKNPHLALQLAINLGIKIKVAGKIDFKGDGYFEEEIEPYLKHPLVEYVGELGFDDKVELLSKAKCNLHPTGFREPFGLTVLEAAYCGTPTLAIAQGSMPELIEEGRTGLLVEDFVEGYHHINECFEMDRSYIANRARALFNYKTMAKQYAKAYEQVLHIFDTRREQDNTLSGLMGATREQLERVWKADITMPTKR
jgi:glycosyltransferase involved in cell wall biosynthesis